ncbi:MAG: phosphoglycerate kinase, partial [Chloroflexi bacterium]|nr:phosphoglycerate kinase [Chloroflexota bacterium]
EIAAFEKVLNDPQRPLAALVGGAKISSKIGVLRNLLEEVDMLLLGGGMANTFLAANGLDMQASLVESGHLADAGEIQKMARETGCEIVLPTDGVMASGVVAGAEIAVRAVDRVPEGWTMLDIGPETERLFHDRLRLARTIVWNGPMGMFENPRFARGTQQVARSVAASGAFSMIGGGDSVAAVKLLGIESEFGHISTGGGASLEMLEGKTLPGISALG